MAVLDFTSKTVCTQNLEASWGDKLGETGRYIYSLKRELKESISKVLVFPFTCYSKILPCHQFL